MTSHTRIKRRRSPRGFTLIEMLMAISISAVIAVALSAALDATFTAYAASNQTASAQTSGRLVMQRLLAAIRKSTLHDAYDPDSGTVTLLPPTDANHPLTCVGIDMILPEGTGMRVWWQANSAYNDADLGDLMYADPSWTSQQPVVMVPRVRCQRNGSGDPYIFTLASRSTLGGLVLARATVDLQIEADSTALTGMESAGGKGVAARLVGSAMPRKTFDDE